MENPIGNGGFESLHFLKAVDPPQWLAPSDELSRTARAASSNLFSSIMPFCPKSPFDKLLIEGFDSEQIWQQIDLQTQPLLPSMRRHLRRFEKNPEEITMVFGDKGVKSKKLGVEKEEEDDDDDVMVDEENDDDDDDVVDDDDDEEEEEAEEDDDEEGEGDEDENGGGGIEDKFLKIKELEEYLEEDEAKEYGLEDEKMKKKSKSGKKAMKDEDEEEEEDDEDEVIVFPEKNFA